MIIKLYIGGIPADMDEMALAQMVGMHGDIATLKIVRDKMTRKSKGYAFVEMVNEEGAAAAADALNKTVMGDKILDVKPADLEQAPERPVKYERVQRANEPQRKLRPRRPRL
jgi:RNA recognition motif-containing protein